MLTIEEVIKHVRHREYMSGIERDKNRTNATQEVFTPTAEVQDALSRIDDAILADPTENFLDSSCGDGQFLSEVLIKKLEAGLDFEQALSSIFGVDFMSDNVKLCQDRLLCGQEQYRPIVKKNIVCGDTLTYHYRFDGTPDGHKDPDELLAENAELQAEIERHRKEKHQMQGVMIINSNLK